MLADGLNAESVTRLCATDLSAARLAAANFPYVAIVLMLIESGLL